jgi:serine phosphatase RsbU (regulator of sigma subunit)/energy-coupling factor transporter transmembrane protein EcfT
MRNRGKKFDVSIGILLVLTILAYVLSGNSLFKLLLWPLAIVFIIRLLLVTRRKLFWKIRNRLIFSGLFLVVTPIFFITVFFLFVGNVVITQYGSIIIGNILNDRLNRLEQIADAYLRSNNPQFMATLAMRNSSDPSLNIVFWERYHEEDKFRFFFKTRRTLDEKKIIPQEIRGYFMVNNKLYHGVLLTKPRLAALLAFEITQANLDTLLSISDFKLQTRSPGQNSGSASSTALSRTGAAPGGNPASTGDQLVLFPIVYEYKYLDFDNPADSKPVERTDSFLLVSDSTRIYRKIDETISRSGQGAIKKIIYALIVFFGTFIAISLLIGFRMVRVITRSINQLTNGTQRIRSGDFSFRIKTRSGDQMQYLAESFNEMAAGIDRLLIDEKEKQRLEEELRIARSIQLKLLPDDSFESEEFELAAVNIPAAEIAGDYFDYFYEPGAYLSLLVADVSGKGASAAFYMAELKGVINHLQGEVMSPAALIAECHNSLKSSFDRVTFITLNVAQLRIPGKKFALARAGHTPAIFYNAREKTCTEIHPKGMAIGLTNFSGDKLQEIELPYDTGDILLLFSDGLTEIMDEDEEMIGMARVKKLIQDNRRLSAGEIKQKILDFSIEFSRSGISRDDLTFIVLKVK